MFARRFLDQFEEAFRFHLDNRFAGRTAESGAILHPCDTLFETVSAGTFQGDDDGVMPGIDRCGGSFVTAPFSQGLRSSGSRKAIPRRVPGPAEEYGFRRGIGFTVPVEAFPIQKKPVTFPQIPDAEGTCRRIKKPHAFYLESISFYRRIGALRTYLLPFPMSISQFLPMHQAFKKTLKFRAISAINTMGACKL